MSINPKAISRILCLMTVLALLLTLLPGIVGAAEGSEKVVRVAYYLAPGYQEGEEGAHKTGFGYEYLQELARINNWKYEYVYGSFEQLLGMLETGEIDLMGNLFYADDWAAFISYGSYEQGQEESYLYVNKKHTRIDLNDLSTLNGKRVGLHNGASQQRLWDDWCLKNNVRCVNVSYLNYEKCEDALNRDVIDAAIGGTLQQDMNTSDWEAAISLGTTPFYFGVSKQRTDLLEELNYAQGMLLEANPSYNEEVYLRYMNPVSSSVALSNSEKGWLKGHSVIQVGFLEGFPPLCYEDENGEFKGVMADVLAFVEKTYAAENIHFESHMYKDYTTMFRDLREGKISVGWPAYDDPWPAEEYGFIPTNCLVSTPMMLVYDGNFTDDTDKVIGVINTGSLPKIYGQINYPESEIREYDSYVDAINAIVDKEVSCVLYVSTTYNVHIDSNKTLQHMNAAILPNSCDISMGVSQRDEPLVSILNKGINAFGEAGVSHSLIVNSVVKKDVSLREYFSRHPFTLVGMIAGLLVLLGGIIIFFVQRTMAMRVKASQAEKEMYERLSNTDPLTGLYNRKAVFRESHAMMKAHPEEHFVVAHVDMVHFRLFNTFFGDEAGDRLLCDIADVFRKLSEDYDHWVYGRIEADVFCACLPFDEKRYYGHIEVLRKYFMNYRTDFLIQPKVGMVFVTDPDMPMEAMFTRASLAAKEVTPNTSFSTVIFNETMERELNERQQVTNDMRAAIEQEQFKVYLQPKVSLRTNKIVGAEALVRWVHPKKGFVSPGVFIPVFESNGFITELDRYIWEQVCRLLAKWKRENRPMLPISVNVSRLSMYGKSTVDSLKELVNRYGIEPRYLELELTETAFIDDPEEMKAQMIALKEAGFTILLDDFGSGYSSLNTLKELPVDVLKLDMKFLPPDQRDTRASLVISSIVRMSKLLKLAIIAEGVELPEQAEYLQSIGCEFVQGYLFARPMPVEDYEKRLSEADTTMARINQPMIEHIGRLLTQNPIESMNNMVPMPFACLEYTPKGFAFLRVNPRFYAEFELVDDMKPASQVLKEQLDEKSYADFRSALQECVRTERSVQLPIARGGEEPRRYLCQVTFEGKIGNSAIIAVLFMRFPKEGDLSIEQ